MNREKDLDFQALFQREYPGLLRCAMGILRSRGAGQDKAEDAVQETFLLAWQRREALLSSPHPVGWTYRALRYTIWHMLRAERQQAKALGLLQNDLPISAQDPEDFLLSPEGIVPEEDWSLLQALYLEGYTYQELADREHKKKSALAMKVSRIKEKIRRKLTGKT